MNLSFFIHGVPNGNDIWGEGDGRSYVQNFYSGQSSQEQSKLFVEVLKNKNVTYYTYLREHNVVSAEGRSGSYFGMTIGFQNEFCIDIENLCKLFELVYEKMVKSVLLVRVADNEKFSISRFSDKEDIVKKIQETLFSQIIKSFEHDLVPLDSSFVGDSNGCIKCNILDVGCKSFLLQFKRTLKAMISSDYPTKEALLNSLDVNNRKLQSTCVQQKEQIDGLINQNAQLQPLKGRFQEKESELNKCRLELEKSKNECNKLQNIVIDLKSKGTEVSLLNEKICFLSKELELTERKCREQEQKIAKLNKRWDSNNNVESQDNPPLPVPAIKEGAIKNTLLNFISLLNINTKSFDAKFLTKEYLLMFFATILGIVVVVIIIKYI